MLRTTLSENICKKPKPRLYLKVKSKLLFSRHIDFCLLHQPSGLYDKEEDKYYNAFEKDIAVVHFFFQVYILTES